MVEACAPLSFRVDRPEGRDEQAEVEVERFFWLNGPRAAVCSDEERFPSRFEEAASAFSIVEPGSRHVEGFGEVEIRVQGTLVILVLEAALDAGVDISHPGPVLVVPPVPFPVDRKGPHPSFHAHAHHVLCDVFLNGYFQADVLHTGRFICFQCQEEFDGAVEFHLGLAIHLEGTRRADGFPGYGSFGLLRDFDAPSIPGQDFR